MGHCENMQRISMNDKDMAKSKCTINRNPRQENAYIKIDNHEKKIWMIITNLQKCHEKCNSMQCYLVPY